MGVHCRGRGRAGEKHERIKGGKTGSEATKGARHEECDPPPPTAPAGVRCA